MKVIVDMLTNWGDKDKRLTKDEAIELIDQVIIFKNSFAQVSSEKQGEYFDYNQFLSVYFK